MEACRSGSAHAYYSKEIKVKRQAFRAMLVSICSCLCGLLVGSVAQIKHRRDFEEEVRLTTEAFESHGSSPPLLTDMLQPWALPMQYAVLFGFLGGLIYIAYYVLVVKRRDEHF
jgi:hypothetical protein